MGYAAALAMRFTPQGGAVGAILLNMAVFGAVIAYVLQMASFIMLRVRFPKMERPYVSPLGIAGAAIAALIAILTLAMLFANRDYNKGVIGAAIWFLLGILVLRGDRPAPAGARARRGIGLRPTARAAVDMNLRALLAKASPARSGDQLAGIAAATAEERARAQMALADVPLKRFLAEPIVPYESDEVTRLICDSHDAAAFAPIAHLTVGEFRDWLLSEQASTERLTALAPGVTPGDGRGRLQNHAAAGPRQCRREVPRRHAIPIDHRPARPPGHAPAAQPSHRRSERNRSQHPGWAVLRERRCRHRRQPRQRQSGRRRGAAPHARPHPRALRHSHADLRPGPRHHADAGAARAAPRSTSCFSRSPARRRPTPRSA